MEKYIKIEKYMSRQKYYDFYVNRQKNGEIKILDNQIDREIVKQMDIY